MLQFFRRLFWRLRQMMHLLRARRHPPSALPGDPFAGVREPRPAKPGGRSTCAAAPEPTEPQCVEAIAGSHRPGTP
jgi:hypothetical protein